MWVEKRGLRVTRTKSKVKLYSFFIDDSDDDSDDSHKIILTTLIKIIEQRLYEYLRSHHNNVTVAIKSK